ncbi:MAG: excisionase family DNA binding protein [Afipia broomeae]|jgi:excisionase family DNA binding protein|uniref:helix-turn-helix domain-containing protein n=2 Tax=Erythrobacteraceae TaxID=335929 RepID=UPI001CD2CB90|nr:MULTISPECIES: helix-turn-helix domain-containing protein [Qipengyuania]MCA0889228.1 helix-turn-helix domain-containing protein [Qipengyuania flava]WPL56977.1 helix-turn-helix domain-containing protein [Qipengyuania sp. HL-TH5]|tara:strand:+ start:4 stop:279 length:276 start_codon:yes stop_codon:yes gene_type:complete
MKGPTGMPSAGTTEHLREQRQRQTIEPIVMRVPEACRYLGIGRSTLYVLIGKREIEIIKLGSSTLVLTASLRSLVERRRKNSDEPTAEAVQ